MSSKQYYGSDDLYPYGLTLDITSHRPPPPLYENPEGHEDWRSPLPPKPTQADDLEDYCFQYLPMETTPPAEKQERRIKICQRLVPFNHEGAQLFICELEGQDKTTAEVLVAKVYDPTYYCWCDSGTWFLGVVVCADGDYSREVAAYEHLNQYSDNGAPRYYGSWTFNMTRGLNEIRPVRMILTEYIPAPSLYQAYYEKRGYSYLDPNDRTDIPESFRLEILKSLLETFARQLHLGVNQCDVAPRNVIVLFDDLDEHQREPRIKRLVLVDYGGSTVFPLMMQSRYTASLKPLNPIELQWDGWTHDFEGWVPKKWLKHPRRYREWLCDNFGTPEQLQKYEFEPQFPKQLKDWLEARGRPALCNDLTIFCSQIDIPDPNDHGGTVRQQNGSKSADSEDHSETVSSKKTEDRSDRTGDGDLLEQSIPLR